MFLYANESFQVNKLINDVITSFTQEVTRKTSKTLMKNVNSFFIKNKLIDYTTNLTNKTPLNLKDMVLSYKTRVQIYDIEKIFDIIINKKNSINLNLLFVGKPGFGKTNLMNYFYQKINKKKGIYSFFVPATLFHSFKEKEITLLFEKLNELLELCFKNNETFILIIDEAEGLISDSDNSSQLLSYLNFLLSTANYYQFSDKHKGSFVCMLSCNNLEKLESINRHFLHILDLTFIDFNAYLQHLINVMKTNKIPFNESLFTFIARDMYNSNEQKLISFSFSEISRLALELKILKKQKPLEILNYYKNMKESKLRLTKITNEQIDNYLLEINKEIQNYNE